MIYLIISTLYMYMYMHSYTLNISAYKYNIVIGSVSTKIKFKYTVTSSNINKYQWLDVWCVRENVEEIFVLVKTCLSLMATILFYVAKLSYESGYILLRHGMNVWKGLCMGILCSLIYQLRQEPMLYQCLVVSYHCYLIPSDWQRVWERTSLWYFAVGST